MNQEELRDIAWIRALGASGALSAIRTAAGLSLQEVADHLQVHPTSVLRWERGLIAPRAQSALAYASLIRALGYFVDGGSR